MPDRRSLDQKMLIPISRPILSKYCFLQLYLLSILASHCLALTLEEQNLYQVKRLKSF